VAQCPSKPRKDAIPLAVPFLREPSHILLLLIVVVVLFGAKRLPDSARSLGRSMRIFKSELKEMKNDDDQKKDSPNGQTDK
jgi:TatA/E family protein of Tat protein translocase